MPAAPDPDVSSVRLLRLRIPYMAQALQACRFKEVPPVTGHISVGAHLRMEAQVGTTTPVMSSMIKSTGARHSSLTSDARRSIHMEQRF